MRSHSSRNLTRVGRDRYAVVQPGIDELFETRIVETEPAGNDGAVRAALDDGVRTFIAADPDLVAHSGSAGRARDGPGHGGK
jgi:hypothetical protein